MPPKVPRVTKKPRIPKVKRFELAYSRWLRAVFKEFGNRTLEEAERLIERGGRFPEGFLRDFFSRINFKIVDDISGKIYEKNLEYMWECMEYERSKLVKKGRESLEKRGILSRPHSYSEEYKTMRSFQLLQRKDVEEVLQEILDKRQSEVTQFRESFLFNNEDRAKIFKEKFPEPTYKFTSNMSRTAIQNLNRDLATSMSSSLGVTVWKWQTSLDEAVRKSHRRLEGKLFKKGEFPLQYNDWGCRCFLEPQINSIEGLEDVL